jgi:hypothetical protein
MKANAIRLCSRPQASARARFSTKVKVKKEEDAPYFTWTFLAGSVTAVSILPAGFVMSCRTDYEFYEQMQNEHPDAIEAIEKFVGLAPDPQGNIGVITRAETVPVEMGDGEDLAIVQMTSQEVYHVRVTAAMSMADVKAVCVEQGAKAGDTVYDVVLDPAAELIRLCPATGPISGGAASSSSTPATPAVASPVAAAPATTLPSAREAFTQRADTGGTAAAKTPAEQLNALRLQEATLKHELAAGSDRSVDVVEMELLGIVEKKRNVKRRAMQRW